LLEEDHEWELQTLMYILLSLLIYKNHCNIQAFNFHCISEVWYACFICWFP